MTQSNQWTEIKVSVPIGWQELVADALGSALCTTVQIGDHSIAHVAPDQGELHVRSYVLSNQDNPALRDRIDQGLTKMAQAVGAPELQNLTIQFKALPAEDYATSWKKSWKPFRLRRGQRSLGVLPPWETPAADSQDIPLILEPGGAFGSGRHATTRTCMAVLLDRVRGGENVLDAGMGSGILAVTSLLLGASQATGFDIDEVATQSAQDLAQQNGVQSDSRFFTGGFDSMPAGPFDIVLANIYSDVISEHAEHLREVLHPNGWFAFSGCPVHHHIATQAAIEGAGLIIDQVHRRGRWFTFVGHRSDGTGSLAP